MSQTLLDQMRRYEGKPKNSQEKQMGTCTDCGKNRGIRSLSRCSNASCSNLICDNCRAFRGRPYYCKTCKEARKNFTPTASAKEILTKLAEANNFYEDYKEEEANKVLDELAKKIL